MGHITIGSMCLCAYTLYSSIKTCREDVGFFKKMKYNFGQFDTFIKLTQQLNVLAFDSEPLAKLEEQGLSWGHSLSSYLNREKYVDTVNEYKQFIGRVDFYTNSIKLLKQGWSYPHRVLGKEPSLDINGMFHPLIKPEKELQTKFGLAKI